MSERTTAPPHRTRTLEQRRASYALACVIRYRAGSGDGTDRYLTLVRSAPATILQNGLGQTLAYLLADGEGKPSRQLYQDLQTWLCGSVDDAHPERVYAGPRLIDALLAGSRAEYLRAQQTALALLVWLKRFGDAYLAKSEDPRRPS